MPTAAPDRLLADLNPEQRTAVTATRGPVVILAGAGTGKTRVLTRRVAYAAAVGDLDPARALVVTFTERAAAEMADRLGRLGVTGATARTFHSAALVQLRHFWPTWRDEPVPQILDGKFAIVGRLARRLRGAERYTPIRDLVAEIEWAKVRRVRPEGYPAAVAAAERTPPIEAGRFARLWADYEAAKRATGRIDFEDMIAHLVDLLDDRPAAVDLVRARYTSFSVDEYQDTSPLAEALLERWLGPRDALCVVGDPEQTIYSFSGASHDYLLNFRHRFAGARVITLSRNYRSTPQILELANRLGGPPGKPGQLVAERDTGPAPTFRTFDDAAAELDGLVAEVRRLLAAGVPAASIAVLVRLNAQLPPIEDALGQAGLAYRVWGERFFARGEVRRVMTELRRLAHRPPTEPVRPAELLARVLADTMGYEPGTEVVGDEAVARRAAADALLLIATRLGDEASDDAAARLLVELQRRAEAESAGRGEGLNLLTMHRAKGLEWEAVLLPGWEESTLPVRQALGRPELIAEERRLAYVALTRARTHLWVAGAASRPGSSGTPTRRTLSRFLGQLGLTGPRPAGRVTVLPDAGTSRRPALRRGDALTERLRTWRSERAKADGVPAYVVFPDATLAELVERRPDSMASLRRVPGFGETRLTRYGDQVLALLAGAG